MHTNFFGMVLLIALSYGHGGALAQSWTSTHKRQQAYLYDRLTCPPEIQEAAMRLLRNPSKLPEHLQIREPAIKIDFKDFASAIPPEQRKMLEKMARMQGMDLKSVGSDAARAGLDGQRDATKEQAPGFMSKTHAYLNIDNQLGSACGKACEATVEQSVTIALSAWKNVCALCSDDFASFVISGARIYVDARISSWLMAPKVETFPLTNREIMGATLAKANVRSGRQVHSDSKRGPEYLGNPADQLVTLVALDSESTQRLCSIDRRAGQVPRSLAALQSVACGRVASKPSPDSVSMTFSLLKGETSCSVPPGTPKAIGCGRPDLKIELTFEGHTTFSFQDFTGDSKILVGARNSADEDGTLAVIHEVGHWFGLQHVVPPRGNWPELVDLPDIMQNSAQSEPCITPLSVNLINAMADRTTQKMQRLGGGALLPRTPKRK